MPTNLSFVLLGILTGILAGFFGVGGGIIMVPALMWIYGFSQQQAQGMSLTAMLLPVGIFGVMTYYKANPFPIKSSLWIAFGILFGTLLGSVLVQYVSPKQLRVSFGILMIIAAAKMILAK